MNKQKLKWFKFFYVYKDAFIELNPWNCKKLLLALLDHVENGYTKVKLNKKTQQYLTSIMSIHNADIELSRKYGRSGGLKSQGSREGRKRKIENKGRVGI